MSQKDNPTTVKSMSFTRKAKCRCGNLNVKIQIDKGKVSEIGLDLRNSDLCRRNHAKLIGALTTELIKKGISIDYIAKEIEKLQCVKGWVFEEYTDPPCMEIISDFLTYYS